MVLQSDAISNPWTMMVQSHYTGVTTRTMVCSRWLKVFAGLAIFKFCGFVGCSLVVDLRNVSTLGKFDLNFNKWIDFRFPNFLSTFKIVLLVFISFK